MRKRMAVALAAGLGLGSLAVAQTGRGPGLPPEFRAYLSASGLDRTALAPPPAIGSERDRYDRAVFAATRRLAGSPRWAMATSDGGKGILKAFACAAGVELTPEKAPALVALLSRYRTDMIQLTRLPADAGLPRPYQRDAGPVCLADKALAMASGTPAIQSGWGWTVGLILSEALPARTQPIMARARAYGESAAVCGFASASEVAGGRELATALLARARAEPGFAADLVKAKEQVAAAARAGSGDAAPQGCAAEAALIASPAW